MLIFKYIYVINYTLIVQLIIIFTLYLIIKSDKDIVIIMYAHPFAIRNSIMDDVLINLKSD